MSGQSHIVLPTEMVQQMFQKSILDTLTGEQKEAIIAQGIAYLMTPEPAQYGRTTPSPMQRAFNNALETVAHTVIRDAMNDPANPLRERIKKLVTDAFEKMIALDQPEQYDSFVTQIAASMRNALTKDR